jgi:hypothetical protein
MVACPAGVVPVLGGAAGVVVAAVGLPALVAAAPAGLPGVNEAGNSSWGPGDDDPPTNLSLKPLPGHGRRASDRGTILPRAAGG